MKPHEEWLFKAQNDLGSAKYLLTSENPYFDIIVYHSQQCAEKALKAFLAYADQDINKTHSLLVLTEKCMNLSSDFDRLIEHVSFLNPFSTLYRYPMNDLMPSLDDTNQALKYAQGILDFVQDKF